MKTLDCPISAIERLSGDTRRVLLDLPPGEAAGFKAGQYLKLLLGERALPFSIASSPRQARQLELHVRPTPDSKDSALVEAALDSASTLRVQLPFGDCFVTEAPPCPLLLVAASTGITQMKSIIEYLEPDGFAQPVHLHWGVLAAKDLYLAELCESWAARHERFRFVPVVSEPDSGWQGRTGLVGEAALADRPAAPQLAVIIAGGPAMVYATLDAFVAQGVPEACIRSDIFSLVPR